MSLPFRITRMFKRGMYNPIHVKHARKELFVASKNRLTLIKAIKRTNPELEGDQS